MGDVFGRTGYIKVAIDLTRLPEFKPAGLVCKIVNEDGKIARLPELKNIFWLK